MTAPAEQPAAFISGRVVGMDVPDLHIDRAFELASEFPGFQGIEQQINGEFFVWVDAADEVSNEELIRRTQDIVAAALPTRLGVSDAG